MVMGESRVSNMILRMIDSDKRKEIDNYINYISSRDFAVMTSIEQVKNIFSESLDEFMSILSEEEFMDLRSYTGYNFRNINAILRGNWTYETNGMLTSENRENYKKLANSIKDIIGKFNMPNMDFMTFRGTTIDAFRQYGISTLTQLKSLEGNFLYEQGFTSTSILEDTCYFNKDLEDGKKYNIEIRYLISSESNDGVLLIDNCTSYSTNQNEFLLDSGSLSKVIDVKVDQNNSIAVLTVVLIPKKIYDLAVDKSMGSSINK